MDAFVARQPIFDRDMRVHAYELLCRSEDYSRVVPRSSAASPLLATTLHGTGLDQLTGGRPAFVAFSRELLVEGFALLLSPDRIVVGLPPESGEDPEILAAARRLRSAGYRLVAECLPHANPALLELVDFCRVDFAVTATAERHDLVRATWGPRTLLATSIDTPADFEQAGIEGFGLFQGLFFHHAVGEPRDIGRDRSHTLELLEALGRTELDLGQVERLVRGDLSLCYRLLRYLNSAAFGWRAHIESVGHALVLLGDEGVRRWLWLSALGELSSDRPDELVRASAVRGWLCESIGEAAPVEARPLDLFLTGMLSMVDAILHRSMPDILEDLSVPAAVRSALLDRTGAAGAVLRVVEAAERADWPGLGSGLDGLGLPELAAAACYRDALSAADALLST